MSIALIGDYDKDVTAHKAIPLAIDLATKSKASYQWIHTDDIGLDSLSMFSAFWCVPASPYSNMENVLEVIKYARSNDIPWLGTCGGYQHAALEFARNVLGYSEADNAEVNAETTMPLISTLCCKLYDVQSAINLVPGSFVRDIYQTAQIEEEYFCGYGVNAEYLHLFDSSQMSFSGFDEDGDPRALEIKQNKFFVGTAFQPERSALSGKTHPLIQHFVRSARLTPL